MNLADLKAVGLNYEPASDEEQAATGCRWRVVLSDGKTHGWYETSSASFLSAAEGVEKLKAWKAEQKAAAKAAGGGGGDG